MWHISIECCSCIFEFNLCHSLSNQVFAPDLTGICGIEFSRIICIFVFHGKSFFIVFNVLKCEIG